MQQLLGSLLFEVISSPNRIKAFSSRTFFIPNNTTSCSLILNQSHCQLHPTKHATCCTLFTCSNNMLNNLPLQLCGTIAPAQITNQMTNMLHTYVSKKKKKKEGWFRLSQFVQGSHYPEKGACIIIQRRRRRSN